MSNSIVGSYIYRGHGNNIAELACNGGRWYARAERKYTTGTNSQCWPMGSLIVNPGCRFILFDNHDFTGRHRVFDAGTYPQITRDMTFGKYATDTGVPCMSAFLSSCQQTYPTCVPRDAWETVVQLDNSRGTVPTTFTFTETVGTTFSTEIKQSFGVSLTVESEISGEFFELFEAKLGISTTTRFDWTRTDTKTRSESQSFIVNQEVPAGAKFSIQQAVGRCGASVVSTQLFRTING